MDTYFTVLYCPNELDQPRLGMVMARKRVRRSVDRNRLKRVVRESFRRALQQLGSLDLVVIAKSAAVDATNATVFSSLADHWRRVRRASGDGKPDGTA